MGSKPKPPEGHPDPVTNAEPAAPEAAAPPASTGEQAETLDEELARTRQALDHYVASNSAEIHGLLEIMGRKRRLLAVNFLAGLSRGVGFFLGMTLVGGLLVGALALFVDWTMGVLQIEDVSFRSILEMLARKAVIAQEVWEDVKQEEELATETAPDLGSAPVGSEAGAAAPDGAAATGDPPDETARGPPSEDGDG